MLIQEVLNSWEKRVTKVAKSVIGEKTVVCGRSTKWWDEEIKGKIKQRREVYRDFDITETANYGRSIVSCVKK